MPPVLGLVSLLAGVLWAAPALQVSVGDGPFVDAAAVSPLAGQRVRLRVVGAEGASVRWFQLLPDVTTMYKNANFPWDPNPYKWVGQAKIRIDRQELTKLSGTEVEPFRAGRRAEKADWTASYESPVSESPYYNPSAGSFWFEALVEQGGRVTRVPKDGLRVSVRDGEGYLGWLTSYMNVPGVFGSVTAQATSYLGVDCADAVSAAWGKWTGRELTENLNVAALVTRWPHAAEFDWGEKGSARPVRWGAEVRPGDLVAVRYKGARSYQHVGALVEDADGDGLLTPPDLVFHAGPMPPAYGTLELPAFRGHLVVLRPKPPVVDRPISFSSKRLKATAEYIRKHYEAENPSGTIAPRMVVLHWTGSDSLDSDFKTFDKETLAGSRPELSGAGDVNVSAHFLVDKDGSILRLMPEDRMARHVIGLNLVAVGIENVGGTGDRPTLTEAQAEANAWLVRMLKDRFPDIEYLIGHHEYRRFEGSALWKEADASYRTAKSDPGGAFMAKVRAKVADLGLKAEP